MAHFVGEKVASKLPLVFCKTDEAWNSWIEVFNAWEAGELIGEDGKEPSPLIKRVPLTDITKTDVVSTLGLRDSDLIECAKAIIAKRICIKNNSKTRDRLTLPDWCRDTKLDRVIKNELMWKLKQYPLPCKDAGWTLYADKEWDDLAEEKNFTDDMVRNVWTDLKKYTDGSEWLKGRANAMNPTTDKSKNGIAPPIFNQLIEAHMKVSVPIVASTGKKQRYDCLEAESIRDVLYALDSGEACIVPITDCPKLIVLFAYSSSGDPTPVRRENIMDLAKRAVFKSDDSAFIDDNEGNSPTRPEHPEIPVPMLFIGDSRQRDILSYVTGSNDSSWLVHTVYYHPSTRAGFKKSDMDSYPLVTMSLSYPKTLEGGFEVFKKFTGIQKPVDWFQTCPEGVRDYNGGDCGVDHETLEKLIKPSLRSSTNATIINIWGGGNVTEIGLVRFPPHHPLLLDLRTSFIVYIGRQPIHC